MDFFDKLGDVIITKETEVSEKAKELAEIASLKGHINTCEEVIRKNYLEIGKLYCEMRGQEPEEEYEELCLAVKNAKAGIEELEEKIRKIRGI